MRLSCAILTFFLPLLCWGQYHADSAQARIVFPHFVNGGDPADYWETSLAFVNASNTSSHLVVTFRDDAGRESAVEMNGHRNAEFSTTLSSGATTELKATNAPQTAVSGYVTAWASVPVQAVCTFRRIQNGRVVAVVTAEPSMESYAYTQRANRDLGLALVNAKGVNSTITLLLLDEDGHRIGSMPLRLGPWEHRAFNIGTLFPELPESFNGMLLLEGEQPSARFYAWALYDDGSRVNTALPSGRWSQPAPVYEVAHRVFAHVHAVARQRGVIGPAPVRFVILEDTSQINAYANRDREVIITLPLLELLADSPDELAFFIGHELGHIAQFDANIPSSDPRLEYDADEVAVALAVLGGYNPYAIAGALGRAHMVTGTAGLATAIQQTFHNMSLRDAHGSLNQRIEYSFSAIRKACSDPQLAGMCADVKGRHRPHLPPTAPLGQTGGARAIWR